MPSSALELSRDTTKIVQTGTICGNKRSYHPHDSSQRFAGLSSSSEKKTMILGIGRHSILVSQPAAAGWNIQTKTIRTSSQSTTCNCCHQAATNHPTTFQADYSRTQTWACFTWVRIQLWWRVVRRWQWRWLRRWQLWLRFRWIGRTWRISLRTGWRAVYNRVWIVYMI